MCGESQPTLGLDEQRTRRLLDQECGFMEGRDSNAEGAGHLYKWQSKEKMLVQLIGVLTVRKMMN